MNIKTVIFDGIALALIGFVGSIYWPVLMLFMPFGHERAELSYSIEIPKISAYAPIIANVDYTDPSAYTPVLAKGVALAKGFSDFGRPGTIFLFSHSALSPWEMTHSNTAFLRLNEVVVGDEIIIKKFDTTYRYKVTDKRQTQPELVNLAQEGNSDQLILQSTTPMGFDFQRILIFAKKQ